MNEIFGIDDLDYIEPDIYVYINSQDGLGNENSNLIYNFGRQLIPPTGYNAVFSIDNLNIDPTFYHIYEYQQGQITIGNRYIIIQGYYPNIPNPADPQTYWYILEIPQGNYTALELQDLINNLLDNTTYDEKFVGGFKLGDLLQVEFDRITFKVKWLVNPSGFGPPFDGWVSNFRIWIKNLPTTNQINNVGLVPTTILLSQYELLLMREPIGNSQRYGNFFEIGIWNWTNPPVPPTQFLPYVLYSPRSVDLRRSRNLRIICNFNTNSATSNLFSNNNNIIGEIPIPYFWDEIPTQYILNEEFQFTQKVPIPSRNLSIINFQILSDSDTLITMNGGGYRMVIVYRLAPDISLPTRDLNTLEEFYIQSSKTKNIKKVKALPKKKDK